MLPSLSPLRLHRAAHLFTLLALLCLPLSVRAAESVHLWARQLDAQGDPLLIRLTGEARLFGDSLRLLAERLSWAPEADWLEASGRVELAAPGWELRAERLEGRPGQGWFDAEDVELHYEHWLLNAAHAEFSRGVWRLHDVVIRQQDSPLQIQAASLRLLPDSGRENLLLEEIQLPGLPWRWPALTLNLPQLLANPSEVRSPTSLFQPEAGIGNGGLYLGLRSELWRDPRNRLYGRLGADPLLGPVAELSHEWRPAPEWLLHSDLAWGRQGLQAQSEALWQSPVGLWLRGRARWQRPDSFFNEFWLPPLQPNAQTTSDLEAWLASDWLSWGPLRTRWLAGGRWPQTQAGLTGLTEVTLWESPLDTLEISLLANGLALPAPVGTLGGRLLYQRQLGDQLTLGTYLEQYVSGLGAASFWQPERLSPWLSAYVLWQPLPDLGLGFESGLSLSSGRPVLANGLVSWRLRPFYFHLLLQALPASIQLQTRFEL